MTGSLVLQKSCTNYSNDPETKRTVLMNQSARPQTVFGCKTKSSSIADLRLKARRHQEAILKGVFLSGGCDDDDLD